MEREEVAVEGIGGQGDFGIERGRREDFEIEEDQVDEGEERRGVFRGEIAGGFEGDGDVFLAQAEEEGAEGVGVQEGFAAGKGDATAGVAIERGILEEVCEERIDFHGRGSGADGAEGAGGGRLAGGGQAAAGAEGGAGVGGVEALVDIEELRRGEGDGFGVGAPGAGQGAALEEDGGADAGPVVEAVALDADYGEGEGEHDGAVRRMNSSW